MVKDSTVPMQGAWVKSLVGELRPHFAVLHGQKIKKKIIRVVLMDWLVLVGVIPREQAHHRYERYFSSCSAIPFHREEY